jgi:hypothetical protein
MRYSEFRILHEQAAAEVNLAQRLKKQLSGPAKQAIHNWETANWVNGDLSTSYSKQDSVYQEIERAAEQIRSVISKREGRTIPLYRGIQQHSYDPESHANRPVYSWTSRPRVAAVFAGLGQMGSDYRIVLNRDRHTSMDFVLDLSDAQARQIQHTVLRHGRARWKQLFFKTSSVNSDFTDIFRKVNGRFREIGDEKTDNLANWLIKTRQEEKQFNTDVRAQGQHTGHVVKKQIPVEDIVWVLNTAGSMEYIVKNHPGIGEQEVTQL